ncbi:alpha/beta fold hydrolase [Streptomyces malaysiensis]|uniref:alpha/beta fold hydrolase n=1 Tax=Streptomyces malaysiensis TaxID=92644 RepID=UPI002B2C9BAF|nr:alpha/beta fold hydrolase [Streptomyces malaysiensis]
MTAQITTPDPVILVHGAWHDARCWDRLIPLLSTEGHKVVAVDLPGRRDPAAVAAATLADFTAAVVDVLDQIGEPVTLVGHSLGGLTTCHVAEQVPESVARLVHIAAFVPTAGQCVLDIAQSPEFAPSLALRHEVDATSGTSSYPTELAREAFYGEVADLPAEVAAGLVPENLAVFGAPAALTPERFGRVPQTYVACARDRVIPIAVQRAMCRAAGIDAVLTLDTDHSPFLSRPAELAAVLSRVARS